MLLLLTLILGSAGETYQAEWTYEHENYWPGVCLTGQQQSPINIVTSAAVVDRHGAHIRGPLSLRGYSDVKMTGVNNGHTVKFTKVTEDLGPFLSGGPLRGNYTFLQFHFHWLSEHAIDGFKYPLEVHMVHIKTGLTLEQAVKRPDGLAVIGIFFRVKSETYSGSGLDQIMTIMPGLIHHESGESKATSIDISPLFSPDIQSYYTYQGSLTTPLCQEVVTWIVMDKPNFITDAQYKQFRMVDVGGTDNYRSLQPVNRVVYRSAASCGPLSAGAGLLAVFAHFITCSTSTLTAALTQGLCNAVNIKKKLFGEPPKECSKLD